MKYSYVQYVIRNVEDIHVEDIHVEDILVEHILVEHIQLCTICDT